MEVGSLGSVDALQRLARQRDPDAWAAILSLHGREIQRAAHRILGDGALAEDACQETLLQIRDRAAQFNGDSDAAARSWIMRIACNTALQMLRSKRSAQQREKIAGQERMQVSHEHSNEELKAALRQELDQLADHDRLPIVLHYYGELDYAQLSVALNCPEGTAKARVRRGLEKLRNRLALLGIILAIGQLDEHLNAAEMDSGSTLEAAKTNEWQQLLESPRKSAYGDNGISKSSKGGGSNMVRVAIGATLLLLLAVPVVVYQMKSNAGDANKVALPSARPATNDDAKNGARKDPAAATEDTAGPAEPLKPASTDDIAAAARGNNAFALDLYGKLREKKGNLFFSPYSISTALAMTYAGARNDTAAQMAQALHFTLDQEHLHPAMSALIASHNPKEGVRLEYQLNVANRLWGQRGFAFKASFLSSLNSQYSAGMEVLDFKADAEAARVTINTWVEKATQDKIKDLIAEHVLPSNTVLVLTNAVYFKGTWKSPFEKGKTTIEPFFPLSGKVAHVKMMKQTHTFKFGETDGLKILEMPYAGNDLVMTILLPDETEGLPELEARLDPENLRAWLGKISEQKIPVHFPSFKMTWGAENIVPQLKALGMTDAFEAGKADLSGINGNRDLFVGFVLHKAFIDVYEEGTVAAAATAVAIYSGNPKPPPSFRADHPFVFLIRDVRNDSILFIGRVTDPQ